MKLRKLTDKERKFLEEQHDMVYRFMGKYRLREDEFYGVVIIGLIKAVQDYLADSVLQEKYAFSTIAFNRMKNCVCRHFTYENREIRKPKNGLFSSDCIDGFHDFFGKDDSLFDEKFTEILISSALSKEQIQFADLLMQGFRKSEISKILNKSINYLEELHLSIRLRLAHLFISEDKPIIQVNGTLRHPVQLGGSNYLKEGGKTSYVASAIRVIENGEICVGFETPKAVYMVNSKKN